MNIHSQVKVLPEVKNIVLPEYVQDLRKFSDGDMLNIRDSDTGEILYRFIYDMDSDEKWIRIGG